MFSSGTSFFSLSMRYCLEEIITNVLQIGLSFFSIFWLSVRIGLTCSRSCWWDFNNCKLLSSELFVFCLYFIDGWCFIDGRYFLLVFTFMAMGYDGWLWMFWDRLFFMWLGDGWNWILVRGEKYIWFLYVLFYLISLPSVIIFLLRLLVRFLRLANILSFSILLALFFSSSIFLSYPRWCPISPSSLPVRYDTYLDLSLSKVEILLGILLVLRWPFLVVPLLLVILWLWLSWSLLWSPF